MNRGRVRQIVAIAVSGGLLWFIYSRIDLSQLVEVFSSCRLPWLLGGLSLVVVTVLMTSWKLTVLAPESVRMSLVEAVRLTLTASVLNMVLPSKMGDFVKAFFIRDRGRAATAIGLPLVIFEKTCDVLALLFWCCIGLIAMPTGDDVTRLLTVVAVSVLVIGLSILGSKTLARWFFRVAHRVAPGRGIKARVTDLGEAWDRMHAYFWGDRRRLAVVVSISLATWLLHLFQIWIFIIALRGVVPFVQSMGLTALSIFAGLVIPSSAGIGTRDLALIYFYRAFLLPETAAALGILCTLRYVLPAIAGLPFFGRYLAEFGEARPEGEGTTDRAISR